MRDHTSLLAWQAAHGVVRGVLAVSRRSWRPWAAAVFAQVQRASLSVQLNLAEGYASGPGARRRYLLRIAYASAVETTDLLELMRLEFPDEADALSHLTNESRRTQALVLGLLRALR